MKRLVPEECQFRGHFSDMLNCLTSKDIGRKSQSYFKKENFSRCGKKNNLLVVNIFKSLFVTKGLLPFSQTDFMLYFVLQTDFHVIFCSTSYNDSVH